MFSIHEIMLLFVPTRMQVPKVLAYVFQILEKGKIYAAEVNFLKSMIRKN